MKREEPFLNLVPCIDRKQFRLVPVTHVSDLCVVFCTLVYNMNPEALGIVCASTVSICYLIYLFRRDHLPSRQCQRSNRPNSQLLQSTGVLIMYFNLLASPRCSFSAYEACYHVFVYRFQHTALICCCDSGPS